MSTKYNWDEWEERTKERMKETHRDTGNINDQFNCKMYLCNNQSTLFKQIAPYQYLFCYCENSCLIRSY